jgi:DNA-directed RNA polymerase subunit RPC12/RpoP
MSISIRCPKCSQVSPVPDAMGGSLYTCGSCGATLRVPAVAGATTPANQTTNTTNPFEAPATGAAPES